MSYKTDCRIAKSILAIRRGVQLLCTLGTSLSMLLQATLPQPWMSPQQVQWPARPAQALRRSHGRPRARIGALGMTGYTYSPPASAENHRQVSSWPMILTEVGKHTHTPCTAFSASLYLKKTCEVISARSSLRGEL